MMEGVKGLLEFFRKFISFGSLTHFVFMLIHSVYGRKFNALNAWFSELTPALHLCWDQIICTLYFIIRKLFNVRFLPNNRYVVLQRGVVVGIQLSLSAWPGDWGILCYKIFWSTHHCKLLWCTHCPKIVQIPRQKSYIMRFFISCNKYSTLSLSFRT